MGETLAPTPAPGGIAGTGVAVLAQVSVHRNSNKADPGPAPEKASYSKKSEESQGALQMLDLLVRDLDKEMTVGEAEEKDAQADYEQTMSDSAEKRASDSKTVADKKGVKADTTAALEGHSDDKASASKELAATLQVLDALNGECGWMIKYFDIRKEARTSEIDALGKAKAVLNGAEYSLMQTKSGSKFLA